MNREPPLTVWLLFNAEGRLSLASHMMAKGVLKPEPIAPSWDWKLYTLDAPELDGTDGAHPAWWRGHDHGAAKAAEAILAVIATGKHEGTFANATVEAAAAFARGMVLGWEQRLRTLAKECAHLAEQVAVSNNSWGDTVTELEKRRAEVVVVANVALQANAEYEETTRALRSRLEDCAFNLNAAEERAAELRVARAGWVARAEAAESRIADLLAKVDLAEENEVMWQRALDAHDDRARGAEARVMELEDQLEIVAPFRRPIPDRPDDDG